MRRIKHFFFLVCLLAVGTQSAWAQKTCTFNNCTYNLYGGYTITYEGGTITVQPYAVLTGITGTAQDVVIPYSLEDGGTTYYVSSGSGFVRSDNVKTLTFQSNIDLSYCTLTCSQLTKIVFDGSVKFRRKSEEEEVSLKCASLTDIVFKGEVPALSGSWSNYCTAPVGNVTAHVAAWTAEECIDKHESNITVWHDFADIVPYNEGVEETVKVSVTVERASFTGMTSSETISTGNTSSAVYERSKRSNYTFTIDPDFSISMYNLEAVYVNGKDITANLTDVDGKKRYTIEDLRDDVFIRVVGGRKNCYIAVAVDDGGTVGWDGFSVTNMTSIGTVPKATGKEFTITPKEGYEFDRCWLTGWNVAVQYPDYLVSQGDGSYKLTIPSIDMDETTLSVSFKEIGMSRVHVKVVGSPKNVGRLLLLDFSAGSTATGIFDLPYDSLLTLNRTDTLTVGTKYKFRFLGAQNMNLKSVTINGEELEVTGTGPIKTTSECTLGEYDDYVVIEFEPAIEPSVTMTTTDGGTTSMSLYLEGDENARNFNRSYADHFTVDELQPDKPIVIYLTPDDGFDVKFFFGNNNAIPVADETIPEEQIPGQYLVKEGNSYVFTLPYEWIVSTNNGNISFSACYSKKSIFDVNGDGEINVSDVTALVSKILHP